MSTYYYLWKANERAGQAAVIWLAGLGVLLAVGWLLIEKVIPARWQGLIRWLYVASLAGGVMLLGGV